MGYEAAKRMEDFAKEILRQTPAMQKKMWESLKPVLTADEIHGLKCYVGLFHMFTDQRFYDAVKKSVGEQIYKEAHTA
jgi:hypothetical protein